MEELDWQFIIKSTITILVVSIGWVVVNWYNSRRDLKNKKRETVTKYLIEVYKLISQDIKRGDSSSREWTEKLDDIGTQIQLFGTPKQIEIIKDLFNEIVNKRTYNLDPILNDLRNNLRGELELDKIEGNVIRLNFVSKSENT